MAVGRPLADVVLPVSAENRLRKQMGVDGGWEESSA